MAHVRFALHYLLAFTLRLAEAIDNSTGSTLSMDVGRRCLLFLSKNMGTTLLGRRVLVVPSRTD